MYGLSRLCLITCSNAMRQFSISTRMMSLGTKQPARTFGQRVFDLLLDGLVQGTGKLPFNLNCGKAAGNRCTADPGHLTATVSFGRRLDGHAKVTTGSS